MTMQSDNENRTFKPYIFGCSRQFAKENIGTSTWSKLLYVKVDIFNSEWCTVELFIEFSGHSKQKSNGL